MPQRRARLWACSGSLTGDGRPDGRHVASRRGRFHVRPGSARMPSPDRLEVLTLLKVPHSLAERVRQAARVADRSISGQIRHVLRAWAEQQTASGEQQNG